MTIEILRTGKWKTDVLYGRWIIMCKNRETFLQWWVIVQYPKVLLENFCRIVEESQ